MRILLLLIVQAFADPQATVWARNPAAVREYFPPAQYKMLDATAESERRARSGYLRPDERNALFHRLEMEKFVVGWDAMDKDILVMSAKAEELPLLKKQYPKFPEATLRHLQHEVRELAKR